MNPKISFGELRIQASNRLRLRIVVAGHFGRPVVVKASRGASEGDPLVWSQADLMGQ